MQEYSVSSLINDVINTIKQKISDATLRFAVSIDSNLPSVLIGDEQEVRKILVSFLEKAVNSSQRGFVSLFVFGKPSEEPIEDGTLELVIDVTCSGCEQQLEKLQQKYKPNCAVLAKVINPEKKNVLIYERRETYVSSLIFAVDNLGADHTLVANDDEFYEKMESRYFNYLFIANQMYKRNREIIDAYKEKINTTIISKHTETVQGQDYKVLDMPVYCITIAEILNGHEVEFTAPDARVLVVDDVNINLHITKELLTPYKMHVDLCNNGKDAIQAVKTKQYDLVFMDHMMPQMCGIAAVRQIRALGGKYKDLPIIALSANISEDSNKMFLENGFNGFISKPVYLDTMRVILEKWLPKEKRISNKE